MNVSQLSQGRTQVDYRSYLRLLTRILLSAGLLVWLGLKLDWQTLAATLQESRPVHLMAALLTVQLTVLASTWKWLMLVRAFPSAGRGVSFVRLARLYYLGLFFNNFLPSSVGGDVMRVFYLGRSIGAPAAAASVAMERLSSGIALVVLTLGAACFMQSVRPYIAPILIVAGIFAMIVAGLAVLVHRIENQRPRGLPADGEPLDSRSRLIRPVRRFLQGFGQAVGEYRRQHWRWWVGVALLSGGFQVGMVWINDWLFRAMHLSVPWADLFVIISLISVLTMLPISVNGLGVREVGYLFFFRQLGVDSEIAVSVSLLFFILVLLSSLCGGLFWLVEKGEWRREAFGQPVGRASGQPAGQEHDPGN
jgi:hypothetical protein